MSSTLREHRRGQGHAVEPRHAREHAGGEDLLKVGCLEPLVENVRHAQGAGEGNRHSDLGPACVFCIIY